MDSVLICRERSLLWRHETEWLIVAFCELLGTTSNCSFPMRVLFEKCWDDFEEVKIFGYSGYPVVFRTGER